MIQLCRHIFHRGTACKGAAVRGTEFCRHHSSVKAALAHVQPRPDRYGLHKPLPFVYPEDRAAIQTNLFLVLQAFNDRKIDTRTANCMTYNLQVCRVNLGNQPLAEPSASADEMVQRVILTPEGDEIAPPREALEPGEQSPLHHKDCPCRRCAEQFRNAPPEQHHVDCQCGLCEDSPSRQTRSAHETDSPSQLSEETTGAPSLEPEATRACPELAEGVGNDGPSPSEETAGAPSLEPEATRVGGEELALSEAKEPALPQQCDACSASSVVKNNLEPTTDNWGLGTVNCGLTRTAPATKLYDQERTKDPVNQPFNLADYLYGDAHKKHEAQYAARARAAIEAGLEPPPYEPFDPSKVESEDDRRYREDREQIERNREAARLSWNKLYPDNQVEPTPYLTWGEQHDLKLAQARKQREEEEARARAES